MYIRRSTKHSTMAACREDLPLLTCGAKQSSTDSHHPFQFFRLPLSPGRATAYDVPAFARLPGTVGKNFDLIASRPTRLTTPTPKHAARSFQCSLPK